MKLDEHNIWTGVNVDTLDAAVLDMCFAGEAQLELE